MRHVAQRSVDPRIYPRQVRFLRDENVALPHQQKCAEQYDRDHRNDQRSERMEVPMPRLQHVAAGVGHDQDQRQAGYRLIAGDASQAVDGARQLVSARLRHRQIFGKQRTIPEGHSTYVRVLGPPRHNPSLAVHQHYGSAMAEIDRAIDLEKIRLIERRADNAGEAAVGVAQPPRYRGKPSIASH